MKFFKKLWRKVRGAGRTFSAWFRAVILPEAQEFINDNKGLAMKFAREAACEYAGQPSHLKFKSVQNKLIAYFKKHHGEIEVDNQWINTLIEIAVLALKSQGEI